MLRFTAQVNNNGGPPCNLTAPQQAAAFVVWAGMVAKELPGTLLVGPDTGGRYPLTWLKVRRTPGPQRERSAQHPSPCGAGRPSSPGCPRVSSTASRTMCTMESPVQTSTRYAHLWVLAKADSSLTPCPPALVHADYRSPHSLTLLFPRSRGTQTSRAPCIPLRR